MTEPRFLRGLERALGRGLKARAFPMASLWVGCEGEPLGEVSVGGASATTRFDTASLTKPIVVVTAAMRAVSQGLVRMDEMVAPDLPSHVTVRALLGHRAGLPAWKDLVAALPPPRRPGHVESRYAVSALVRQAARDSDPGRGVEYSDLGFILLGAFLAERLGVSLEASTPVGAYRGTRAPSKAQAARYAPTGYCQWRKGHVQGVVHDPNAWVMGGVAGHAGVFATASEVGRWALALERLDAEGQASRLLPGLDAGVVHDFWDPAQRSGAATWLLGWDSPSAGASSGGRNISARSVGHLGFTGTSVWIDRERRLVTVLLTNRVALGASAQARLKAFRPELHDAVRALVDAR